MFVYIESILIIIFEILCCKLFYGAFGAKRYQEKDLINIMQILLLCVCAILSSYFLIGHFLIRQLFNVIIVSVVMYWHIRISYKKSVFLAILYEGLLLSSDYIAFSINTKLFSSNNIISQDYGTEGMLVTLFGKTILFLCILFIRKRFDKKTTDMLADSEWIRFLLFPIFTIVVISAILSSFKYLGKR